ncbi:hypothetical protein ZHS_3 [Edwardsiella phage vB_EpM_ZHS]|jgi:hypothetical protein|nr:hypothetical protein ZHS_3 [Edwardsiella phage vB_EpM_ZHS]
MATSKQKAKASQAPAGEEAQQPAQIEQEAPQSQAVPHPPTKARKTAPIAPKATSGNSPQVVLAIRNAIAEALYTRHADAIPAGIEKIGALSTLKAHPSVAAYKAEALDYLRGKLAPADEEQEA